MADAADLVFNNVASTGEGRGAVEHTWRGGLAQVVEARLARHRLVDNRGGLVLQGVVRAW